MEHAGGRLLSVHSLWAVPCGQHRSGFRGFDYLYFFCILLDIKLPALFVFEQVARKIRPRCMCWGFWRSWLRRFLSAQWSLAVRLFFVWWPWVMWWEDITIFKLLTGHGIVHSDLAVRKYGVVHKFVFSSLFMFKASDGVCDAGFPQTLQWKTKPLLHVCRAQCPDYHGKSYTHAAAHTLIFIQGFIVFI